LAIAFAPDGKLLAVASDLHLHLWNVADGTDDRIRGDFSDTWSVAFSPDGTLLAAGTGIVEGGKFIYVVKLWDLPQRTERPCLRGQSDRIWSLAFAPDSKTLASASDDRTVKLWDVGQQKNIETIAGFKHPACVAFSPDGKSLAIADGDQILWDVATRTKKP